MMNRGPAIDLITELIEAEIKYLDSKVNTTSYTTYEVKAAITRQIRLKDALDYIKVNLQ